MHLYPKLDLQVHASSYELGAVLSHVLKDRSERPVAFAIGTRKNYSQMERVKFPQYILELKKCKIIYSVVQVSGKPFRKTRVIFASFLYDKIYDIRKKICNFFN